MSSNRPGPLPLTDRDSEFVEYSLKAGLIERYWVGHPLEEDDNGRWEAAGFHLHLPSSLAGSKDPSRKQEHAPLVQSQRLRQAGSALHAVASSPSTISLTLAAAGIPYVEEAGKLDKKAVCRVGRGPERAVLPRLPPREKRWVGGGGRGCPMRSPTMPHVACYSVP